MSRSALGSLALPATLPASWAYRGVVGARNWLFEREALAVKELPVPVVSVGNITVGGSGKTPLVAHIARHFLSQGRPVAVLSRGYRRALSTGSPGATHLVSDGRAILGDVKEAGDEPMELAQQVRGLAVAVGADRYRAGMELLRLRDQQVFILDDGFQHRRLARNLDLVCIDSDEPVETLRMLPAGRLREPLGNLDRADALVWTRWREGHPTERLASRILQSFSRERPIFRSVSAITGLRPIADPTIHLPTDTLRGQNIGVLAAIAQPQRLRQDLEACGARVVWSCEKRDHHAWQADEVMSLLDSAQSSGARAVVTTGKDAVKMSGVEKTPVPLYRAALETRVLESEAFEVLLDTMPGLESQHSLADESA
jgi:tetraacyldisaccharide 4'-kinase